MGFVSGKKITLKAKLNPADTSLTADVDIGITAGRLYFVNDLQEEWIDFTGVSASGSNYSYTGLTRGLSQTADPATAGTGKTWLAGNTAVLVAMHDQIFDRQSPEALVFADTTARDSALGGDGAATKAYMGVYTTSEGLHRNYNLSTNQWESIDTGTTTPNASETVAGKVEIATSAETKAGTDVGGTGASLSALPSDIAANTQSGTFLYAEDEELITDAYVVNYTPAITALTIGMTISFSPNNTNTGACTINVNGLGAKSIKTFEGNDPADGDLYEFLTYDLKYDGTYFILQKQYATTIEKGEVEMATDAEALAGTDEERYINPKQLKDSINYYSGIFNRSSGTGSGDQIITGVGFTPRLIKVNYTHTSGSNTVTTGMGSATSTSSQRSVSSNSGPGTGGLSTNSTVYIIGQLGDSGNAWQGNLTAIGSDGFTINFTMSGTPGDISVMYECFK